MKGYGVALIKSIDWLNDSLQRHGYISDRQLTLTLFLALKLQKPVLIEGEPGVGKTEVAKALSRVFDANLIRLQCYEGLDENKALYEWNYQRQLIRIQLSREEKQPGAGSNSRPDGSQLNEGGLLREEDLFSEEYLLERPLLKAIRATSPTVLLIDEVDKTDEEFESFLFEVLSDFTVSVPELGTIKARQIPIVVLTSNNQRQLSDGLKRRCVYHYIDFPSMDKEKRVILAQVPEASEELAEDAAAAVNYIRRIKGLKKQPSIAETLDWVRALITLKTEAVDEDTIIDTLTVLLKNREDVRSFTDGDHALQVARTVRHHNRPGQPGRSDELSRPDEQTRPDEPRDPDV